MAKIKYKINGYWKEIQIEGTIEAVEFENDNPPDLGVQVQENIESKEIFGRP